MGTHPIYESDFDCLTEFQNEFSVAIRCRDFIYRDSSRTFTLRSVYFFKMVECLLQIFFSKSYCCPKVRKLNDVSTSIQTRVENNHYFFDRMVKMVMVIGSEKKGMVGYGYGRITILTIFTIFSYNGYKMVLMVMEWFLWFSKKHCLM